MNASACSFPIVCRVWKSSIGRKLIVALTGLVLVLFIAGHLAGNLLVFVGRDAFNEYAELLKHLLHGAGIWIARLGLLGAVALHIAATVSLTAENKAARTAYAKEATIQASKSSLIMIWSGITILVFVIYHLLHFTLHAGNTYEDYRDSLGRHDAWKMVIDGFSVWYVSAFYILAMTLLCSHLSHGIGAMFQTLGLRSKKSAPLITVISKGSAILIWLGFISIPIAINFFGFGR
ncbi:succinate dehydrogenase cytochrome b subunit [Luteolibacter arcticus]|uniref:Succinate dehydrogenase cytochrome b subunit n=1 Tax=Luteolibacter arcticus TaxID=1581411 RepID=A0ABT3GE91_9BACT|nr:succinate dehydrogenase cytochrome b subunit [Luteolibacter arcticus]MCW1921339.1 succinate dehydrogenase cytochrome b subunit [Luteolibacter arcticus]